MRGHVVAMLLDSALSTWGTREDLHMLLAKGLMARGVSKVVLVFSQSPAPDLQERYRAEGIAVEFINYKDGAFNFFRRLRDVVRTYSVTAVHIAFFTYFSWIPWMARLSGVRHVIYHERNPGIFRATSLKRLLLVARTRLMSFPMTRVISISHFLRETLAKGGIPPGKISVIHHGVDTARYCADAGARERVRAEHGIPPGELMVVSLCQLMRHKNIDTMLEAVRQLTDRGFPVRLLVIGSGPMRTQWEELAKSLDVVDRVQWLGRIPDPVPILQACDVFLLISEGEGFGLAIAEAMSCGIASIGTVSGAVPEIVEDGKSGLLIPLRDATALADAIYRLGTDEPLRRTLARAGMDRVHREFTIDVSTAKIVDLYASVLPPVAR